MKNYANKDLTKYTYEFEDGTKVEIKEGEAGVTKEIIKALDEIDHEQNLKDRYYDEHNCVLFKGYNPSSDLNEDDGLNLWANLKNVEYEEAEENNNISKLVLPIDDDFTDAQKDLFYELFGKCKTLEEIAEEESLRKGKKVTRQAIYNRKEKMLNKLAKKMGLERER